MGLTAKQRLAYLKDIRRFSGSEQASAIKSIAKPIFWNAKRLGVDEYDLDNRFASYSIKHNTEYVTGIAAIALAKGANFTDVWGPSGADLSKFLGVSENYLNGYMAGWDNYHFQKLKRFEDAADKNDIEYIAGYQDGLDGILPCLKAWISWRHGSDK